MPLVGTPDSDLKPVVMVVEPEVLVRMTIAEALRDCGYTVIEGIVAEDVWTVLSAGAHLDVVFSEVQLAGDEDGFALAKRVRQTNPEIEVVLTSGFVGAAEKSKDLCEEGPMRKPYRSQDVVTRIKLLLERRRSSQRRHT